MALTIPFPRHANDFEWVGNSYTFPNPVREGGRNIYPTVLMWLELPSGAMVGTTLSHPKKLASMAEALEEAMRSPREGDPRRPSRVRVPDEQTAAALRASLDGTIEVVVAPVPELDEAFDALSSAMNDNLRDSGTQPSYLDGGSVAPAVVEKLFLAAGLLYRAAPWRRADEAQVMRVDIPKLHVEGACLSVIGGAGVSAGLMLFRSIETYMAFAAGKPPGAGKNPGAAGANQEPVFLSLSFDRKKDLTPTMVKEIERYRWQVAGPKAHPVVLSVDGELNHQPVTTRDFRVMTACALAFQAFYARHADLFDEDVVEEICESFTGDDNVTVTITAPYDDSDFDDGGFFESSQPQPPIATRTHQAGRNDPCPCGSGKKYKKCHLDADRASGNVASKIETVHEMDFRLVMDIGRFASRHFGSEWTGPIDDDIGKDEALLQLFPPWSAWTCVAGGRRVADRFRDENESLLSPRERDWMTAQSRAWLSIWEVTGVAPGSVQVRDLLTGERRSVHEEQGSRSLVVRDTVLVRMIDFEGIAYFGGLYGRSLSPAEAQDVLVAVRTKLRSRKKDITVEQLRNPIIGRFMIDRWRDAVAEGDARAARPPILQNTDGDTLLFVTESFRIDAATRPEIEKRLAAMEDVDQVRIDGKESEIVFAVAGNRVNKSWENTVIGRVLVTGQTLQIETNSEKRADALGRRVRDACAGLLHDPKRKRQDPSSLRKTSPGKARPPGKKSAQEVAILREMKDRHYSAWIDTPIPALDHKTPRAAMRSARLRDRLDLLLRDIEYTENRLPESERHDFGQIRRELGLGD
jgi:hypothetical protein